VDDARATRVLRLPKGLAGLADLRRELLGLGRHESRERGDMAVACWPLAPKVTFGFMPDRLVQGRLNVSRSGPGLP